MAYFALKTTISRKTNSLKSRTTCVSIGLV